MKHRTNRSTRVNKHFSSLLALLFTTSYANAVKSGGHICCACTSCEEHWFSDGWICRATFLAQIHPDARWMSTRSRGSTQWHLIISSEYGVTIYNQYGQITHHPDWTDSLIHNLTQDTHPPLNVPASAPKRKLIGVWKHFSRRYQETRHGTSAQCSTTTRLSPRFCFLLALLLSCVLDRHSTEHILRLAQPFSHNWKPMASLSRALYGVYARILSWRTTHSKRPIRDTPLEQQNKQWQITRLCESNRADTKHTAHTTARHKATAADFRRITGHKAGRKVALTYKEGPTPYVCTCCNAWIPHINLWTAHTRTNKHCLADEWLTCPPTDTVDNHNNCRNRLPPVLVILVNSSLAPEVSPDTPLSVTEGGPVAYPLMNKRHITQFMENKASFNKCTLRKQFRIEDKISEYPFALFPYLHREPEPWFLDAWSSMALHTA